MQLVHCFRNLFPSRN